MPAQVASVLQSTVVFAEVVHGLQKIFVSVVDAVVPEPGVGSVGNISVMTPELNVAVDIAAPVGDVRGPQIQRVDALRQKREGTGEVEVLAVGEQSQLGLDPACPQPEPGLELVVQHGPVDFGMVLAQLPQVPVIDLSADAQPG